MDSNTFINCAIDALLSLDSTTFDNLVNELSAIDANMEEKKLFFCFNSKDSGLPNVSVANRANGANNSYCFCPPISVLFYALKDRQSQLSSDTCDYRKIEELIGTRSLNAFATWLSINRNRDVETYKYIFNMLSSEDELSKFTNELSKSSIFNNDEFKGQIYSYFAEMDYIFNPYSSVRDDIFRHFYFDGINDCLQRYNSLLTSHSSGVDKFRLPEYTFSDLPSNILFVKRKNQEPDWEINPELKDYVYDGIPDDMSLEDKAIYIYFKLCRTFRFDNGYAFRFFLPPENYSQDFSKDKLESITSESVITCGEFSRVYANFINSLDNNIEAVVLGDSTGHFYTGFFTDSVSVKLDSLDVTLGLNDFARTKSHSPISGIHIISDKMNLVQDAVNKCYNLLYTSIPSVNYYLAELKNADASSFPNNPDNPDNFQAKLDSFIEIMKENNIFGNEAIQFFLVFRRYGLFNSDITFNSAFGRTYDDVFTYIGESQSINNKTFYNRLLCICRQDDTPPYYLFDPTHLKYSRISRENLRADFQNGKYILEDERYPVCELYL